MATTEQFSLRWNNFHSNIASGFHDLLEAADLVDVTLAVEGQFLRAHKLVLSICSPYFKEMFKQNPCKHPIIILKDVTHKNLKDILEFMYLGEVNVLRENLPLFLRTAELLQVKGLSCDDTQSNSSKSSSRSNLKLDDEQSENADDDYDEPVQIPTINLNSSNQTQGSQKRSKQVQNSNAKKVRSAVEELSNRNQKVATKEEPEEIVPSESPITKNDYEGDDVSMEFKQNNDSGIGFMNSSSNNEIAGQEPGFGVGVGVLGLNQKFKCKTCGRAFTRRDHLKTHEKNIHGDAAGPFACRMCSQYYKNAESLRKHMAKFHVSRHSGMHKNVVYNQTAV